MPRLQPFWTSADGRAILYCADAFEAFPSIPAGVDAVITDPPYSSGGAFRSDRMERTSTKYQTTDCIHLPEFTGDNRDQRGWLLWVNLWLSKCLTLAVPGALLAMFSDWRQLPTATDAVQCGGWMWRGIVVWDKVNARPHPGRFTSQCEFVVIGSNGPVAYDVKNGTYHKGVVRCLPPPKTIREHSTQKPVAVMSHLVAACPASGVVLDPFAGSGSTGVACVEMGRRFIGIEMDYRNCVIARRRIERAIATAETPGRRRRLRRD